ncbi:MAG TPA: cytochrome c3 family protein [Blastocatellia bacterium]|nr:cytochrome c3 family protein [Blastocatellia bacterium]
MAIKSLILTLAVAALVAVTVLAMRPAYTGTRAGRADENYITSKNCVACHAEHYNSWARTYHSRMTQEARAESVQGDFERDNTFDYLGVHARMEKREGRFSMTLTFADGRTQTYPIERTVGSRRIEQYVTRQNGQYIRLPLAYDLVNRRWMSLNGSFFYPDNDNFFQHQAAWDANCVFCHNVKAQPNMDGARRFNTEVAELGIACGACHGPAAAHAEEAASPVTRTLWHWSGGAAKQVVQPMKLTPERSLMVCGHCHGQRVPEPMSRIQEILGKGDPFNAGEDLSRYYKPVTRETVIERKDKDGRDNSYSFASRFWGNGSPRLTAYEYQGILRSKCFTAGDPANRINCLTCHTMHGGDPKGMITEENRTNKPCLTCHQQYEGPEALAKHTGHRSDSAGSECATCHMPRAVYGVMTFHPSHDISVPQPQLTAEQGVPNACNLCHLEKSVNWAIRESKRLWPDGYRAITPSPDAQFETAEGPRMLFAGDALTRALAAEAMGGEGMLKPDAQWAAPYLVEAFADNYPIVRFFAANGLAAGPWKIPKPDYLAAAGVRQTALERWRGLFDASAGQRVAQFAAELRARRKEVDVEVGE